MNENKFGKKELSETKIEQLNKMPIIECSLTKSVDGKFFIHKTVITDIRPASYYNKLVERDA